MSDREAFVSAVAANPADDLPRLVFADWLDENGDSERAEFVRTQIRWHHATDAAEKKHLNRRAASLFRDYWQRWLRPFLLALDPDADPDHWYEFRDTGHAGMIVTLPAREWHYATPPAVRSVSFSRGFVHWLSLEVSEWGSGSLAEAFGHEPVHLMSCRNGLHSPRWVRFTDPVLRRVEWLSLAQRWAWNVSAPHSGALLHDPHLAGVREFSLYTEPETEGERPPLPVAWLELFVRSSLAYRLTGLCLPCVTNEGIAPLCRPGRLHLERLEVGGEITANGVRWLGQNGPGESVRHLALNAADLENAGVAALARDPWRKLTRLELKENAMSAAVLPALAAAAFTPQLKELDLSDNRLFFDPPADLNGLRALGEALDPDRLERLDLTNTGLTAVPDFLAERFGDRVTVG